MACPVAVTGLGTKRLVIEPTGG